MNSLLGRYSLNIVAYISRCGGACGAAPRSFLSPKSKPLLAALQVATIKATYDEKYPYKKPWPYEEKRFRLWHEFLLERSIDRMNENSKMIIVEGNIGVGKNEFAKRLAKKFDLKYIPPVADGEIFYDKKTGFDVRDLDHLLSPSAQSYDLKKYLQAPHPEKGTVGRLQIMWYKERCYAYANAMLHLLSTGQGVVVVRPPHSDYVWNEVMHKAGHVTPNFHQYYNKFHANTVCEFFKPHLTIYLDAPINVLRERIKKRADPRETNSKILSDSYLKAMTDVYHRSFLPKMRISGEVMEVDWTEVGSDSDLDVICEEIENLRLEGEDVEEEKFQEWTQSFNDDQLSYLRRFYGNPHEIWKLFTVMHPWECPEILYSHDELEERGIINAHPAKKYRPGWAPELGAKTTFKWGGFQ